MDGKLASSNDVDGYVTITSSDNHSGRTFTVVGYDQDGHYQTETITGSNKSQAIGSKIFKSISSMSVDADPTGTIKIGTRAIGYNLKTTNSNGTTNTSSIPVNASAQYISNKLQTDLDGTGIIVEAKTRALLGPLKSGTSGDISFKLEGKNSEPISILATVDASDISSLAKAINQYSSQTGLKAINTLDFEQIIIESEHGYDIGLTEISAPSDLKIKTIGEDFKKLKAPLLIDVSSSDKNSAFIKGNLRFSSTLSFNNQIDSGVIESASLDPLTNGYIDIEQNSTGETAKIKPVMFD